MSSVKKAYTEICVNARCILGLPELIRAFEFRLISVGCQSFLSMYQDQNYKDSMDWTWLKMNDEYQEIMKELRA